MPTLTPTMTAELFRREPDRFLDVGAGEVAYRRVGDGPDVLLIHGWPVSGATYRSVLPALAEHVTCHVIDLPGSGSSRFDATTPVTMGRHVESVRRVLELLELDEVAVVGHDSGGLIARHALAGDPRMRALGLINTEQPHGISRRFKMFVAPRNLPGYGAGLGWVAGQRWLRRRRSMLGAAFVDVSLLDGEFDEFFLRPLHRDPERRDAAVRMLRSVDGTMVGDLPRLHRQIEVPVQLVWGEQDPFFPIAWAEEMVDTFPDAQLATITGAGLFAHEERPAEVVEALLPILTGRR